MSETQLDEQAQVSGAKSGPFAGGVRGERVLVTGATGNVGLPVALALARDNEVWAAARFSSDQAVADLKAAGVRLARVDFVTGDVESIPADLTVAVNFAVIETRQWGDDLDGNVNAVGAVMARCRDLKAFLHCSTTAVYQQEVGHGHAEDDPLGDNHRVWPRKQTYSISKIAAEAVARFCATTFGTPTTIARLNVPYGEHVGGWPAAHLRQLLAGTPIEVHSGGDNRFNPIHEDDIVATVPKLLGIASVPAQVVNWGGSEEVSIEDWCRELAALTGTEATFRSSADTIAGVHLDLRRMHELIGPTTVGWREGMRRVVEASR